MYWVFMDDFSSIALTAKEDTTTMETIRASARKTLARAGLSMHKDGTGEAVPLSLGVSITEAPYRLNASTQKLSAVIAATGAMLKLQACSSKALSKLVGSWIWVAMCCRAGFAVLDGCFKFITKYDNILEEQPIWKSVRDELHMLYYLAPLFTTQLDAPWSRTVFATDASETGWGIVETEASLQSVKEEVNRRWECEQLREMARGEMGARGSLLLGQDWSIAA